jgi:hypothetical protein
MIYPLFCCFCFLDYLVVKSASYFLAIDMISLLAHTKCSRGKTYSTRLPNIDRILNTWGRYYEMLSYAGEYASPTFSIMPRKWDQVACLYNCHQFAAPRALFRSRSFDSEGAAVGVLEIRPYVLRWRVVAQFGSSKVSTSRYPLLLQHHHESLCR